MIINSLITIIFIIITIAFYTVAERKILGSIQRRKGPNVVGFWGCLQAFADGIKLIVKEIIIPSKANSVIFIFSPILVLSVGLGAWLFIPFSVINFLSNYDYSLLMILAFSSLGVYGIIGAGWASNSKYAFLGGLRSTAQLISYEVSILLIVIPIAGASSSFNICTIVDSQANSVWNIAPFLPSAVLYYISILAETNRAPFDLPEAEAELVAGYNVEYSSIIFALFFLGEYSNMLWLSFLFVLIFCGGWGSVSALSLPILMVKVVCLSSSIILVRACYPRYRYDQLMSLG